MNHTLIGFQIPPAANVEDYGSYRRAFEWDLPDRYNIATACLDHGDEHAERTALHHVDESGGHHEISFAGLDRASDELALAMGSWGICQGSHVGLCFPQSPELLVAHLATYKLGAVSVPISVLQRGRSLEHELSHSGAELLLIDRSVGRDWSFDPHQLAAVDRVELISLDPGRYDLAHGFLGGFFDVAEPGSRPCQPPETSPDTPALLLYTSGTSSEPKGVLHGHRYLIGSLPGNLLWYDLLDPETASAQRIWTPSEWAWAGALFNVVFTGLAMGSTVVSSIRRAGFDPQRSLSLIDDVGVTRAFLPPTALSMIRDAVPNPPSRLSTLEIVQCGGEPLSPAVQAWAERELDLYVNVAYGQTEANALVGNCRSLFDSLSGSMGRAYPGHDVRLIDDHEEPVETGQLGEITIAPPDPAFLIEYWRDPEATHAKFTAEGALKTGDMAIRDEDGYFWFRGRRDDLIVSSGYRISPAEIEEILETHPDVEQAVVGDVDGPNGTTRVKAYLRGPDQGSTSSSDWFEPFERLIRRELGAHKAPDEWALLGDRPQTWTGKIDRKCLFD